MKVLALLLALSISFPAQAGQAEAAQDDLDKAEPKKENLAPGREHLKIPEHFLDDGRHGRLSAQVDMSYFISDLTGIPLKKAKAIARDYLGIDKKGNVVDASRNTQGQVVASILQSIEETNNWETLELAKQWPDGNAGQLRYLLIWGRETREKIRAGKEKEIKVPSLHGHPGSLPEELRMEGLELLMGFGHEVQRLDRLAAQKASKPRP